MIGLTHQQKCCLFISLKTGTILIGLLNLLLDLTMTSVFILAIFTAQVSQKLLLYTHTLHIAQIDPLAIFHETEQEYLMLSKGNGNLTEVTPGRK